MRAGSQPFPLTRLCALLPLLHLGYTSEPGERVVTRTALGFYSPTEAHTEFSRPGLFGFYENTSHLTKRPKRNANNQLPDLVFWYVVGFLILIRTQTLQERPTITMQTGFVCILINVYESSKLPYLVFCSLLSFYFFNFYSDFTKNPKSRLKEIPSISTQTWFISNYLTLESSTKKFPMFHN